MTKRSSLEFPLRPLTERRRGSIPENKLKMARAGSYKDASITKYIYSDETRSEANSSSSSKKEELVHPELQLLKSKTTCEVGENPFLKLRKSLALRERDRELKKIAEKPKVFENESMAP